MNNLKTNFFKSVAHHNLERFHSETIAWIFNTFSDSAKNFIKSIHTEIPSIDKIEFSNEYCWAELNQIDILLKYSYDSKNYQLIIENKMKASEHKIEAEKLIKGKHLEEYSPQLNDKEIEFLKLSNKVKLSQTEYYYFREKLERAEQIVDFETNNDKLSFEANPKLVLKKYISEIASTSQTTLKTKKDCIVFLNENINDEYCRYVYLKPSRVDQKDFTQKLKNDLDLVNFDFNQLNDWNKRLGKNPWITITYEELIKIIQDNDALNDKLVEYDNIIIANAYLKFIEVNIKEKVYLNDFNINKEYARFDYFKLLFALVKLKFKYVSILNSISNDNKENSIFEYIQAGSSNGGIPLFAFYKKILLPLDDKFDFFKPKRESESINIGIQIQGENIKAYVSAEEKYYDSTTINEIKKEEYAEFVRYVLNKITENWKRENKLIFTDKEKDFHPNTTKTFYSRSYKIKNFIESEKNKIEKPRDIFSLSSEISDKVNQFINNSDIKFLIKSYEITKNNKNNL